MYYDALKYLEEMGKLELPHIPAECTHNAHMFYVKLKNLEERTKFIAYLKEHDILSVFHYIPLHSAPAGQKFGHFHSEDVFTTKESERLARLPMYYGLSEGDQGVVIETIKSYFA